MRCYGHWQPLVDENAHTALAFGFFRHAPRELALEPWLSDVLRREATSPGIAPTDFWPNYRSRIEGAHTTEPELVFDAHDGEAFKIVIEAKPGYAQQRLDQVAREVVDTAHATGASRIACVMIGADLGPPMPLKAWSKQIVATLNDHGLQHVHSELHYASWASIGIAARRCGEQAETWKRYADDVVQQLQNNVLMGYDGAPSLQDLDELTISNAVEAYHRTVEAGRQFFLALHGQPRFKQLELVPHWGNHRILRAGLSESPTSGAVYFETTVLLSLYRDAAWPKTRVVFASIYLGPQEDAEINVGLGDVREHGETMVYRWAHADDPDEDADIGPLVAVDKSLFPYVAVYESDARWVYDSHAWVSGRPEEDLTWAALRLEAAKAAWDAVPEPS